MILTREKVKRLIESLELLFPEPDPNAKVEDYIGCFEDIFPKNKSSVDIIREERNRMFGLDGTETVD